jgi:hypothetical protein
MGSNANPRSRSLCYTDAAPHDAECSIFVFSRRHIRPFGDPAEPTPTPAYNFSRRGLEEIAGRGIRTGHPRFAVGQFDSRRRY